MTSLEVFQPQPEFPNEDLLESNVLYMTHLLRHEKSDQVHAEQLGESLRQVHVAGHQALQICGIEVAYSQSEYAAFRAGFAAHEYTTMVIRQKPYSLTTAAAKTQSLFIDQPALADLEIAERFKAWQDLHPTTYSLIVSAGEEQGETMQQLQARAMGAAIARELEVA